jgi:hypothetical protein
MGRNHPDSQGIRRWRRRNSVHLRAFGAPAFALPLSIWWKNPGIRAFQTLWSVISIDRQVLRFH